MPHSDGASSWPALQSYHYVWPNQSSTNNADRTPEKAGRSPVHVHAYARLPVPTSVGCRLAARSPCGTTDDAGSSISERLLRWLTWQVAFVCDSRLPRPVAHARVHFPRGHRGRSGKAERCVQRRTVSTAAPLVVVRTALQRKRKKIGRGSWPAVSRPAPHWTVLDAASRVSARLDLSSLPLLCSNALLGEDMLSRYHSDGDG